jgi:hypothetical protein
VELRTGVGALEKLSWKDRRWWSEGWALGIEVIKGLK